MAEAPRRTGNEPTPDTSREVRDAYGGALIALVLSIVLLIATGATHASPGALVAAVLQVLALGVTMSVSGASRRTLYLLVPSAVVVLVVAVLGGLLASGVGTAIASAGWLLLVATTIGGIGKRLATYRRVNMPFVLGLLCVYLLIGMSFALGYAIAGALGPEALRGGGGTLSSTVYFSFVTLTTVGYGDVAPATPLVRAMAVGEAILGQLYLVGVVSLAVGNFGSTRRGREGEDSSAR